MRKFQLTGLSSTGRPSQVTLTLNVKVFQLNVERNPGLHWFCFTLLCDWSRKLAPLYQPITTWLLAFSCAPEGWLVFILSSDWLLPIFPLVLIGRWWYYGFGFTIILSCDLIRSRRFAQQASYPNHETVLWLDIKKITYRSWILDYEIVLSLNQDGVLRDCYSTLPSVI